MAENRLPQRFMTSWVPNKRRNSRPYKSTIHHTHDDIWLTGVHPDGWVEYAQDRDAWKSVAAGVALEIGADGAEERYFKCTGAQLRMQTERHKTPATLCL